IGAGVGLLVLGGAWWLLASGWFRTPGLGVAGVGLTTLAGAAAALALTDTVRERAAQAVAAVAVVLSLGAYLWLALLPAQDSGPAWVISLLVLSLGVAGTGALLLRDSRGLGAGLGVAVLLVGYLSVGVDLVLRAYPDYFSLTRGR